MNRLKKLYILLLVLAVAILATLIVTRLEEKKEEIQNSGETVLTVSVDTVESLHWKNETTELSFCKTKEGWQYDDDENFPVDDEKITELLSIFEDFSAAFIIDEVEDYAQYGLDTPIASITFATTEQSYEVALGDYSQMDEKRYVSIGDDKVYLVTEDPLEVFDAELKDVIKQDEIEPLEAALKIEFTGEESYSITYEENSTNTYSEEDLYFTKWNEEVLPMDPARVESYLNTISYLNLTDYVTYHATDKELQTYGLDQPELVVTVTYQNEEDEEASLTLSVSRLAKEREADGTSETEETEETEGYVRVGDSQIVYQISADAYAALMKASCEDLRHQELFFADFDLITELNVTLEGTDYVITSKEKDEERTYYYQDEELEITELTNALKSLKLSSFEDSLTGDKEEISLKLSLDNENFPEVEIVLYRYDGESCLAEVDGKTLGLLPRSLVVELIEAIHTIVL